jgi:transcriptional regulator
MHPDACFSWTDEAEMRGFANEIAFAHLFAATTAGLMVAHAPVIVTDEGNLRFHLARRNALARHIEGASVLASMVSPDFYVSPDWYRQADQVPTWNYRAIEIEGPVHRLDDAALIEQLEQLSAAQEERLAPKPVWTRYKMAPGRFEAMLPAIMAYELRATSWRGTLKLSQNKNEADREGVAEALEALGQTGNADLVRKARRP